MIPKVIHYCWFGHGKKNKFIEKCINSWQKKLDYKIIEWNESNCDIDEAPVFVKEAYRNRKWAFVSDYFRLKALYENGGIYLDTDVEILKDFSPLLDNKGFICFESPGYLCTAVIGAEKNNEVIKEFMNSYDKREFDETPNSKLFYDYLIKQIDVDIHDNYFDLEYMNIYSSDYFSPKDFFTKKLNTTENTYAIHHFDGTWKSKKQKFKDLIVRILVKILGKKKYNKIKIKFKRGQK